MKPQENTPKTRRNRPRRGLLAAVALLCPLLLAVPSASAATLEQVGCFAGGPSPSEACKPITEAEKEKRKEEGKEEFTEEVQLGGVGGMAVNYTGAGGVPKGTVYAMAKNFSSGNFPLVAMFVPRPDGLEFAEVWWVTSEEKEPYFRCGPLLGTEVVEGKDVAKIPCKPGVESSQAQLDVDVDQATGDVFVNLGSEVPGRKTIAVYKADGSEEIARFGEIAPFSDKISDSPEKIHGGGSPYPGAIAVNGVAEVYVYDRDGPNNRRLMKFKPKAGGGYEYAGTAEDVASGVGGNHPSKPVADAAGHLYVSGLTYIEEFDPSNPADPPVCRFEFKKGGITAMTVNPLSEEVYFYTYRLTAGFTHRSVHELGPCNEATGKFEGPKGEEEVGQFEVAPERAELTALAVDPVREFSADRGAGTLYAGARGPVPPGGVAGPGEPGQSSLGYVFAPKESKETPPLVQSESVSSVTATSAGLHATIDPNGVETHYVFQYLSEASYEANEPADRFAGATEAPPGGAPLQGGSSQGAKIATLTLTGLSPETAYRFRVVASSNCAPDEPEKACPVPGAAMRFRTYPVTAPGLPDHRAYELVSPVQKNGGQVLPANPGVSSCGGGVLVECKPGTFITHFPMQSAPGGDAVAYEGTAFGPGAAPSANSYIARRNPETGWQSVNPTPVVVRGNLGDGYKALAEDLGEGVLSLEEDQPALSPGAPGGYEALYAQPTTSPFAFTSLLTEAMFGEEPPARAPEEFRLNFAGASADLSRVFFSVNDALTGPTVDAPEALDGGKSKFNLYEWERSSGQVRLVNVFPGNSSTEPDASFGPGSAHTVSADGSRAFWSSATGELYVREDGTITREIPGSSPSAKFLAAATDGSKVLLSNGSLYDLEAEAATDLTGGEGGFLGIAGQSDDLSRVYFVDTKALSGEEENCREESGVTTCQKAAEGKDNLYAFSADQGTRFVATLVSADEQGVAAALLYSWSSSPSRRTAEASPHGRYLAFLSTAPLTGFDSAGPCKGEAGEAVTSPCPEVFLYDSDTGKLSCPSCNPSGAAALGWSLLPRLKGGDWIPQARYLTDSGRLYFDSRDSLSPFDTNEGVEDVYEYEPDGVGSCEREEGCVSLISAGSESVDSNFVAADPSGKNVFFTSRDQLVLKDKDELIDLYDAREGGGIAAGAELPGGGCQGEACQPPASAPANPTPGSSSFKGAGNVSGSSGPAKCSKGKVRRRGRCVRRPRKSKKHARANRAGHKRGGAK